MKLETILSKIKKGEVFETDSDDGSFHLKVDDYVPYVCVSMHNGNKLRPSLINICTFSKSERLSVEEPYVSDIISSLPITLWSNDSRFEYDLNDSPDTCVYSDNWGKPVWTQIPDDSDIQLSKQKHLNFYTVLTELIKKLKKIHEEVTVFDFHSYNYKKIAVASPLFNIGTENVDKSRYVGMINLWAGELQKVCLKGIENTVRENDVFYGRGYLSEYINSNFSDTLVLSTQIKKVFCDEDSGILFEELKDDLAAKLTNAVIVTMLQAKDKKKPKASFSIHKNAEIIDKSLFELDHKLYYLTKNFEVLNYVNPINIDQYKKDFISSKFQKPPRFQYRQLVLNPFEFKRLLYNLPVENINDISLRSLYQDVIDSYVDKIEMIASIGTEKFMYNSLRYFGEPSERDISNARYILQCSPEIDGDEEGEITSAQVAEVFRQQVNEYGFDCKIEISNKLIANVLTVNSKKTIKIRKDAHFSEKAVHALSEHEIGVHMLTTINAREQPLKILRLGMPLNTHTQEGLAIMSEYLSGYLSINRLQTIALRLLAIQKLLQGSSFIETFHFIMDSGKMSSDQAFYITARVYRGGGFTKDCLYLKGFKDVMNLYNNNVNLSNLLIGKTSIKYASVIDEMIEKKLFYLPKYITHSFVKPKPPNNVIEYLLKGFK